MKTVFVTGGGGFLGGAVVRALQKRGVAVRGLARSAEARRRLTDAGAAVVEGDVSQRGEWMRSVEGATSVVHCAAATGVGRTWEECRAANLAGTRNVLEAAIAAGVKRFVNVSTLAVYGLAPGVYREDASLSPTGDAYSDTKIDAEAACNAAHTAGKIEVSTVRPALIMGPGDRGFFPLLLSMVAKRRFPLLDGGRATAWLVDEDDVAELVVACSERAEAAGQTYNGNGTDPITWKDFVVRVAEHYRLPRARSFPAAPLRLVGAAFDRLTALGVVRYPAPLRRFDVDFIAADRAYPMDKAKRDLGYAPSSTVDDILAKTFPHFAP